MTKRFKLLLVVTMISSLSNVQGAVLQHVEDGMIRTGHLNEFIADNGNRSGLNVPNVHDIQISFDTIATEGSPVFGAFQPKIYSQATENAPYKACIYFTIMDINGKTDPKTSPFKATTAEKPKTSIYHHIYFPYDGKQPTTSEAAKWSLATVGAGDEDSIVTQWYQVMFGLEQTNGMTVQAGFQYNNPANKYPLLLFTYEGQTSLNPEDRIAFENKFRSAFKKLAANPVGRVLLYRILIEIGRIKNNIGVVEQNVTISDSDLRNRNELRQLFILNNKDSKANAPDTGISIKRSGSAYQPHRAKDNSFVALLLFDTDETSTSSLLTKKVGPDLILTHEKSENEPLDKALFHELLHWYHSLRNPTRMTLDPSRCDYKYVARSYYGIIASEADLNWSNNAINSEELWTILGSPDYRDNKHLELIADDAFLEYEFGRTPIQSGDSRHVPNKYIFLNGDDLSENVYRISKNLKMRFSHSQLFNQNIRIRCPNKVVPKRFKLAYQVATDCYRAICKGSSYESNLRNWQVF